MKICLVGLFCTLIVQPMSNAAKASAALAAKRSSKHAQSSELKQTRAWVGCLGEATKMARPELATVESPAVQAPAATAPDAADAPAADAATTPRERAQLVVHNIGEFYPMTEYEKRSASARAALEEQSQKKILDGIDGSYVDDGALATGMCNLANEPRPGCHTRAKMEIGGATYRGFGCGSIDFICLECRAPRRYRLSHFDHA